MINFTSDVMEMHVDSRAQAMIGVREATRHMARPEKEWSLYLHPEKVDGLYCYDIGSHRFTAEGYEARYTLYQNRGEGRKEMYLNIMRFDLYSHDFIGQTVFHFVWE